MKGRLAFSACCAAALLVAVVVSATGSAQQPGANQAAAPETGAYYEGKAAAGAVQDPRAPYGLVRARVSSSGKTVEFRGPGGACRGVGGAGPYPSFFGRILTVGLSNKGKFKGEREYKVPLKTKTLFWTVEVSGRFVSSKAAKGTVAYEMRYEREGVPGQQTCGRRSGSWSAKLCDRCKSVLGYRNK